MTRRKRYEVGLEKLQTTEASVSGMKEELIALQPQLEVAAKETEAAMEVSVCVCVFVCVCVSVSACSCVHTRLCMGHAHSLFSNDACL